MVIRAAQRFDPDRLDPDDPFEIDSGNYPHLLKRPGLSAEDIYDVFGGWPCFMEYHGPGSADWLMVGEVPGPDPAGRDHPPRPGGGPL